MTSLRSVIVALLALGAVMAAGAGPAAADGPRTAPPQQSKDPAYTEAVNAIKAGQFKAAVPLLEGVVARDDRNADAFTWLGYAVRKDGDPARAIPIYQKALALDPKHRGAHEYIGEAYLMVGDLAGAKQHLARLDSLCFFSCEEYRDLKKAIEAFEKKSGAK
ncbi:MAG TPA: tetratricopeptide repeat protein [Candidatus Binatia bacterium]|nr:tetratricopeptide repeat protein [Candidatus Binatia bacterium]